MVAHEGADVEVPTRDRLLAAGMRLFAEKGFRATTVGDIEAAVGLQPRRGGLYKHFASKQALLEGAFERHLEAVEGARRTMDEVPLVDLHDIADALGRWLLIELDAERTITQLLEKEGDRLPDLRDRFRERVSDAGYQAASDLIGRWLGPRAADVDVDALAVVLLGPLINLRRSTWLYARPPLGIDDERVLAAWVDSCERLVASLVEA
jgi:AcrR family transcriptional regulator